MRSTLMPAVLLAAVALFACGGGGNGGGGDMTEFVDTCVATLGLDKPMCECAAGKASEKLSPDGVAFVIASMNSDLEKLKELGGKLQINEKMAASMIMASATAECGLE